MIAEQSAEKIQESLEQEWDDLLIKYRAYLAQGLNLNMARGKPSPEQLGLATPMLRLLQTENDCFAEDGEDCRNYGGAEGLPEMRAFFAQMLGVATDNVIVGGNSSLNLMFDTIATAMLRGFGGHAPWGQQKNIKFLCPCPGYDRHFGITEYFGIEMVQVPMLETGPDMGLVEQLVEQDSSIKGIWCVPKYSNPLGITFSDETVRRFASLRPAAADFKIFWDNAYCVHNLSDTPDILLNLMEECKKQGNDDLPILFTSTSKITFPGAGVAAMAGSKNTLRLLRERLAYQTIGPDKLNQLRHLRFLRDADGVATVMAQHKTVLAPKFDIVLHALQKHLNGIAHWTKPHGGYFISVDVADGCAKRVVDLCAKAGVTLTTAGATFPYGNDPKDCNIRLAPSFPSMNELQQAMEVFCTATKLAAAEQLLGKSVEI